MHNLMSYCSLQINLYAYYRTSGALAKRHKRSKVIAVGRQRNDRGIRHRAPEFVLRLTQRCSHLSIILP